MFILRLFTRNSVKIFRSVLCSHSSRIWIGNLAIILTSTTCHISDRNMQYRLNLDFDHIVRKSSRAKRIIFNATIRDGIEIVIPKSMDTSFLPDVLEKNRSWIQKQSAWVSDMRQLLKPNQIHLRLLNKTWEVNYVPNHPGNDPWVEYESLLTVSNTDCEPMEVPRVLDNWLHSVAKNALPKLLHQESTNTQLSYDRVTIRKARTRWGSCSSKGSISLNRNLMFLPPQLVRYVLIHELCHTQHLNHSIHFWQLFEKLYPGARSMNHHVRKATDLVPSWAKY